MGLSERSWVADPTCGVGRIEWRAGEAFARPPYALPPLHEPLERLRVKTVEPLEAAPVLGSDSLVKEFTVTLDVFSFDSAA